VNSGGTVDLERRLQEDRSRQDTYARLIKDVDLEDLVLAQDWQAGEYVVWKNCWLGVVEDVIEDITIRLDNGSAVTVEDSLQLQRIFNSPVISRTARNAQTQTEATPNRRTGHLGSITGEDPPLIPPSSTPVETFGDAQNIQDMEGETTHRFTVGEHVATIKGNLRRGIWRYGAYDPNVSPRGYVVNVTTNTVHVRWLCQNMMVRGRFVPVESPDPYVTGEDMISQLKRFKRTRGDDKTREAHLAQVTESVRFKDIDAACVKYNTSARQDASQGAILKIPRTDTLGYDVNTFLIASSKSWVDVQWQDLSKTREWTTSVSPYENQDEHDVWPGDLVIIKHNSDDTHTLPSKTIIHSTNPLHTSRNLSNSVSQNGELNDESEPVELVRPQKVGVIQVVEPNSRIASVRWFKDSKVELAGNMIIPGSVTGELQDGEPETVSLYEIAVHPALAVHRGDIVLIAPEQGSLLMDNAQSNSPDVDLSTINRILPDNPTSSSTPQQTRLQQMVNQWGTMLDTTLLTSLSASLANTTSPQFQALSQALNQIPAATVNGNPYSSNISSDSTTEPSGPIDWFGEVVDKGRDGILTIRLGALDNITIIQTPIERLTVVLSDLDDHDDDDDEVDSIDMFDGESVDDSDTASYASMDDEWITEEVHYNGEQPKDVNEADWLTDEEDNMDVDEPRGDILSEVDVASTDETLGPNPTSETSDILPENTGSNGDMEPQLATATIQNEPIRFKVLEGDVPSDHAFMSQAPTQGTPAFLRRLTKEHKIFNTSLPEGIYVRTWENRLDLLRVLIIGPRNTPYEMAPFLFDFHLGPDFPNSPPSAYFHSWTNGVGRVNPNL